MTSNSNNLTTPEKGFTLIEVLIASAILAVGLLAVSTMIARSTIQDSKAYYTTKASMLIEEFLEQENNKQYIKAEFGNLTNFSNSTTIDGIAYNLDCTITNATPELFCKEMTCTVTWNNKGTNARTQYVYSFCKYD